jgi:hypothetical protein
MRFIVTGRAIDSLPVPPDVALGAFKATFELLAAGKDARITEVYPHADERATTFVIDADTAEDLAEAIGDLPGAFLSTWESHPVESVEHVVESIRRAEAQFAAR